MQPTTEETNVYIESKSRAVHMYRLRINCSYQYASDVMRKAMQAKRLGEEPQKVK